MTKDPVCGMEVNPKKAPTSTYEGKQFAFCSQECKELFDQDPQEYAAAAGTQEEVASKRR